MPNGFVGRGAPAAQPKRQTATLNGSPQLNKAGNGLVYPTTGYSDKPITSFTLDLTNTFTDMQFAIAGTVFYFAGNDGGNAAPMLVKFNQTTNGAIPIHFGDSISGIPFQFVFISNPTAQPGVTATFVITQDKPDDRIAMPLA